MKMLEPIKAYCDLVIAPIEKKKKRFVKSQKIE